MCGLFGFSRTTDLTRLMTPTLAICMEARGGDSWGVTDGDFIWKQTGSIIDTFVDCDLNGPSYHTRARSVGVVSERNAHPFHFEDKLIVTGMHNGHISNFSELKRKHKRDSFEVDSEHIFANIAEGRPLDELAGYGAVVWYEQPADKSKPMRRYFSRWNTESLYFAQMHSGEIAYASTKESLVTAAQLAGGTIDHIYNTEAKKRYYIKEHEGRDKLFSNGSIPWGEKPVAYEASNWSGGRYASSNVWDCPVVNCRGRLESLDHLVCIGCYKEVARSVFGATA